MQHITVGPPQLWQHHEDALQQRAVTKAACMTYLPDQQACQKKFTASRWTLGVCLKVLPYLNPERTMTGHSMKSMKCGVARKTSQ